MIFLFLVIHLLTFFSSILVHFPPHLCLPRSRGKVNNLLFQQISKCPGRHYHPFLRHRRENPSCPLMPAIHLPSIIAILSPPLQDCFPTQMASIQARVTLHSQTPWSWTQMVDEPIAYAPTAVPRPSPKRTQSQGRCR
ncbi:hypothetical protein QBC39DRAFT_350594 [Podospora conica]|nr:hypothetical protein QBC39DRAFT_350594 [Schizothecium conicum]